MVLASRCVCGHACVARAHTARQAPCNGFGSSPTQRVVLGPTCIDAHLSLIACLDGTGLSPLTPTSFPSLHQPVLQGSTPEALLPVLELPLPPKHADACAQPNAAEAPPDRRVNSMKLRRDVSMAAVAAGARTAVVYL